MTDESGISVVGGIPDLRPTSAEPKLKLSGAHALDRHVEAVRPRFLEDIGYALTSSRCFGRVLRDPLLVKAEQLRKRQFGFRKIDFSRLVDFLLEAAFRQFAVVRLLTSMNRLAVRAKAGLVNAA